MKEKKSDWKKLTKCTIAANLSVKNFEGRFLKKGF